MRKEPVEREIIYVGDPMCSWCWGIAPELDALIAGHPNLTFRVVVGGLRPAEHAQVVTEEVAATLRHHWTDVAARSGQPFSYDLLAERGWLYDTEPPCRAVVAMRSIDEAATFPFFKRLQQAFYAEGILVSDPVVFGELAESFGVDPASFMEVYEAEETRTATWADFGSARRWGITGFPTIVARDGERGFLLAQGYASAASMDRALVEALNVDPGVDICSPGGTY